MPGRVHALASFMLIAPEADQFAHSARKSNSEVHYRGILGMNLCDPWLSFDDSALFLLIRRLHIEICRQRTNRKP
jgi:hypothetical protein